MSILAIVLLLASAVLHALWNLILKQSSEKYIAMGWQVIISGIISVCVLFFTGLPPRSMWIFALVSMTLEAIYFVLLSYAYSDNDFSLVYPVARGAAPALVVVWSLLFLSEVPSILGFIGIATIICGLVIVGSTSFFQPHEGKPKFRGIAIALSIAVVISIYTLIDGFAVKHGPVLELRAEYVHVGAAIDHTSHRAPLWTRPLYRSLAKTTGPPHFGRCFWG